MFEEMSEPNFPSPKHKYKVSIILVISELFLILRELLFSITLSVVLNFITFNNYKLKFFVADSE
jgi:hypothetical protein